MTDPARLKLVVRLHSGECSYNLFGSGLSGLRIDDRLLSDFNFISQSGVQQVQHNDRSSASLFIWIEHWFVAFPPRVLF